MKVKITYQENLEIKNITIDNYANVKLPSNIIKIQEIKSFKDYFNISFTSYDNIIDIFKELSLILDTNLPLNEALTILIEGNKDNKMHEILTTIQTAIKNGQSISRALEIHKRTIGILPILFFEIANTNGNIKDSIKALSVVLEENQKAKKQFINALSYPFVLIVTLFLAMILIFNFVIPKFEHIFVQFGSDLPLATKYLLSAKFIFDKYLYLIVGVFIFSILGYKSLYHKYKYNFDKVLSQNIPIISSLYNNFVFYRLFLSLDMLVQSKYRFQIALESVKPVVNNSYIVFKIDNIINDIKNGKSISKAFEGTNMFNSITIRLLHSAQETNTMPIILTKLTTIYRQKLEENIKYFSSAIGPMFIMLVSILILWLVFALMLPIWDLSSVLS